MLSAVGALAVEPLSFFEFSIGAEIFGIDRTAQGMPAFEFRVCAPHPGRPVRTKHSAEIALVPSHGLDALIGCDLVLVGATPEVLPDQDVVSDALRRAYEAGATLLGMCTGAFTLAATGLLDGRRCATHWMHAARLAELYPHVIVDDDALFVDEGRLVTSAGTAAGIDACLHVVRRELGSQVASYIARRMVVPPQRDGGQRQYVDTPMPPSQADGLAPLLQWLVENLEQPHTTATLAAQAHLSERTFIRRFAAETGISPHQWLTAQRVERARHLLEDTDAPVEEVAHRCGFRTSVSLRTHFRNTLGATPSAYRARFAIDPTVGPRKA
ncbi:helix-turn-helix domain-containing protein [Mobilicoccus sp.]|uniref:GlxA family transcriptional regulator n=1 Tax=Mobilicoccus sp. TaxID=2034349 RepID=UPI002898BE7B|nr:helix-turn-helix domain-containing protein [Mobilicoccus sp.]